MAKTFLQEFTDACERLGAPHLKAELNRVHQDAVKDKGHAFSRVDIAKPDPWKHKTELTL